MFCTQQKIVGEVIPFVVKGWWLINMINTKAEIWTDEQKKYHPYIYIYNRYTYIDIKSTNRIGTTVVYPPKRVFFMAGTVQRLGFWVSSLGWHCRSADLHVCWSKDDGGTAGRWGEVRQSQRCFSVEEKTQFFLFLNRGIDQEPLLVTCESRVSKRKRHFYNVLSHVARFQHVPPKIGAKKRILDLKGIQLSIFFISFSWFTFFLLSTLTHCCARFLLSWWRLSKRRSMARAYQVQHIAQRVVRTFGGWVTGRS